ncbi:MAG TPA: metalloregulator ArsR/SmtB family transcription factor [Acidobacteriaceae bacterium]|jgi:DNA-binding transcriptional ArsR family regulator|nr:metalloregulator ArsR/SmtB family transcription factor [Acidobacteriaceae bacterium]
MKIFSCATWHNVAVPDSLRQFKTEIFQALANPTRIAILDELRDGELTVGDLGKRLSVEQSNLSQHLAIMRARQILIGRKSGSQVFYSVRDPLIFKLLDLMRVYFQNQVSESIVLLEAMEDKPRRKSASRR